MNRLLDTNYGSIAADGREYVPGKMDEQAERHLIKSVPWRAALVG